jgi:chloramphenicol O-acetyltransferase type A
MPHLLDLERWPRRAAFEFFRGYDNPYFNVCAPVDVTPLVSCVRSHAGVSFATACLHAALGVANALEPFRYRLHGGGVLVHERLHAATTELVGDEQLAFLYFDYQDDYAEFRANAARARTAVTAGAGAIGDRPERTDVIHFSSLPWVAFTSISHARNWRREDSIPKITFGRYHWAGGRATMPLSVEVHHALMDGVHVARFFEQLQAALADPPRDAPAAGATDPRGAPPSAREETR